MRVLIIASALLVTLCLGYTLAAPSANPSPAVLTREDDLAERFIDFLKEDKEFQNVLKTGNFEGNHLQRRKRQATKNVEEDDLEVDNPKPGFFDRAAKFVTELLQRFLKWVNSSDDRK